MEMVNSPLKCVCGNDSKWKFELRNFHFFRCQNCQLLFVHPAYDAREIYDETYFKGGSHGFGFSNYEIDKIASSKYLTKLLKWALRESKGESQRLLDVGAANGFFLTICNNEGIEAEGVEISQEAVNWAEKLGRKVTCSTIEDFKTYRKYEIISALDVLEHISRPVEFIQSIRELLAEKGIFLINVPYEGSLSAKLAGKKWHALLPPEHWFYFNKRSIRHLLESNGFEVIGTRTISKSFSASYVYLTVVNSPQIPPKMRGVLSFFEPLAKSRIGRAKIFLPLYDNLAVLARKSNVAS
jgi:SAM-dependent methyltransferase